MKFILATCAVVLMAGDKSKHNPIKKDLGLMQGTWKVVFNESAGKQTTAEQNKKANVQLIVKGDKYTVYFGAQKADMGTLKLYPTKKPKAIDAISSVSSFKGKAMKGIYTLEGDKMQVCFAFPGNERPTEFKAKKGFKGTNIGYERVKK